MDTSRGEKWVSRLSGRLTWIYLEITTLAIDLQQVRAKILSVPEGWQREIIFGLNTKNIWTYKGDICMFQKDPVALRTLGLNKDRDKVLKILCQSQRWDQDQIQ